MDNNILTVVTAGKQRLKLAPHPMGHLPSSSALGFVHFLRGVPSDDVYPVSEKEIGRIQHFMRTHQTEALLLHGTDDLFYTVAGHRLVRCNPNYRHFQGGAQCHSTK